MKNDLPAKEDGSPSTYLKQFIIAEPSLEQLPYAYFLFKAHKIFPPLKFRPIISQVSAFLTPLAKSVAGILSPLVGSFSDAHLTNSQDFTTRLTSLYTNSPHLLSAPLLSLDIEALFTNVSLPSVLEFLPRKFNDNNVQLPPGLKIGAQIKLIKLCCDSTVFF